MLLSIPLYCRNIQELNSFISSFFSVVFNNEAWFAETLDNVRSSVLGSCGRIFIALFDLNMSTVIKFPDLCAEDFYTEELDRRLACIRR